MSLNSKISFLSRATCLGKSILLSAAISAGLAVSPAAADTLNWTLQGVTFQGGGTATGTFETDGLTGQLLTWNILTTGVAGYPPGIIWTPAYSLLYNAAPNEFNIYVPLLDTAIRFLFTAPLTSAGENQLNTSGSSGSYQYSTYVTPMLSPIVSGSAFSIAVPEPKTLALLGVGLLVLGLLRIRLTRI